MKLADQLLESLVVGTGLKLETLHPGDAADLVREKLAEVRSPGDLLKKLENRQGGN